MAELSDTGRKGTGSHRVDAVMSASDVNAWFVREVLPLEAILMHYLRRHWPDRTEVEDLRQDIYVRVHEAAQKQIPHTTKPFVFAIARNLLIDRVRQQHIVPIEAAVEIEALDVPADEPGPDRSIIAREELRRLQAALELLPPRCREAVVLGRIEGLSGLEIAHRMGIGPAAVSAHLAKGIYALADILHGAPANSRSGR